MHIAITSAAVAGCLFATVATAQTVGIATSNPGSLFHNIGTAVANAANESGLDATIQPATSPNQYIPFVNSGGVEFGVANLQEVSYAIDGSAWWNGQASPDLRVVALLMPLVEAVFVRADGDIKTLSDLEGRRVTWGYTAQQTIIPQYEAIFSTADLDSGSVEPVMVSSVVAGADAFMAGDADAFIFAQGAGKVREADAAVGGLYALPLEATDDAALAVARSFWPLTDFVEIKAGTFPGVTADATYIAFPQALFTNASVPDDVVYEMAKALYEGKAAMAATFPPFGAFDPDAMFGQSGAAQFHPGALRFFEEKGLN